MDMPMKSDIVKLDIIIASLILGMGLAPVHAAMGAVDSSPLKVSRAVASDPANKKLDTTIASLILDAGQTRAHAAVTAVDSSPPKVSRAAPGDPVKVLLERARYWENRGRADLAKSALEKLFHVVPDHPDGLAVMGVIEAKAEHLDIARNILGKLRGVKPDHPAIRRIETLIRLYGADKDKFREARELVKQSRLPENSGQTEKALAALRALYPDGPPDGDLALEYWQLVANTKNGWKPAYDGLSRLALEYPDNQYYRLALAEHESYRYSGDRPVDRKSLQVVVETAKMPEFEKQAKGIWRNVLLRRTPSSDDLPLLQEYLAFDPEDSTVKERQQSIILAEEKRRRMKPAPSLRAKAETVSLLDKMDPVAAEPLLEKALREHPDDADAVGEMGLLRLRQEKHAQAHELFTRALQLTQGKSSRWRSLVKTAQFWQLLHEARDARKARDFTLAESKLNEAIKLDSKVVDAYAILAGVQDDRGQASAATAAYRQALSIEPLNSEALEGLAAIYRRQGMTQAQRFIAQLSPEQRNVLSKTIGSMEIAAVEAQAGDPDEFLPALARIPADKRPAHISRLWANNLEKLVDAHTKAGRRNEAAQLLQEAEALAENDEEAGLSVAASWGRLGDYKQADRMFDGLRAAHTPPSTRWRLRHAGYLAMKSSKELRAELDAIAALPSLSSEEARELFFLQESLAVYTANAQTDSGAPGLAHQTLAPLLKTVPDRAPLLLAEARAYQAEKQWASAQSAYAHVLRLEPGDGDAMRGLVETKMASGDRAAALALLDEWAAGDTSGEPYNGLKMAGLYLALGEQARARQQLDTLLERYPNHTIVLYEAAQMAHRDGRLDNEIAYLKKSVAAEQAERAPAGAQAFGQMPGGAVPYEQIGFDELGSPAKIQRDWKEKRLAVLIDRRATWFSSAAEVRSRSGTTGMSEFHSSEIPLEYKTPWHTNDEVFFRTDLVKLNAGDVNTTNDRFGSLLLCQPACASAPLNQNAQGMSFTAGYQRGDFSADIGFTPRNFPVSNAVGGIRQKVDLDGFGYTLEASRRPVTDSLLSFAGSHDPNTGKTWGGVVATGARLDFNIDKGGAFGFWSTLGWHNLTGRNVQSNRWTQVMAGGQWRMISEENRRLIAGLTGMYWGFAENAGEYTFGHGGYFSPHNYRSVSLPITYAARSPRFSYMLQGSVSATRTRMRDAQFFPTDSAMQAKANALAPVNFITPVYTGTPSRGTGYSMTASCEYQVAPQFFAGGLFSIDRAQSYAPNRAMLYLRYALGQPGAQPVFMPPEPLEPSSRFK